VKKLEVKLPHELSQAEVRARIDQAVGKARNDYSDQVSDLRATWVSDDRLELGLTVMSMPLDAEVENLPRELVVRVGLPAMASLFAGQIRAGIERRIGGLLTSQPA
jgi:hypothetical protein